jgi:signal transduction histidine kinase
VSLGREGDAIVLAIDDDGAGIGSAAVSAQAPPSTDCFGIVGMRERAAALGGALAVCLRAAGGTRVEARLPRAQ